MGSLLPQASLRDLAVVLYKRRWGMAGVTLATIACALLWMFVIRDPLYMADARLLVRLGQEQAPLPTMVVDRSLIVGSQSVDTSAEVGLLRSRDLLGRLVDEIDLTARDRPQPQELWRRLLHEAKAMIRQAQEYLDAALIAVGLRTPVGERDRTIEVLSRLLTVESSPTSNVITVGIAWSERGVPALLLERLLDLYFEQRFALLHDSSAASFFSRQRDEAAARLRAAELALAAFERDQGITVLEEQKTVLLRRLAEAERTLDLARAEEEAAETLWRRVSEGAASGRSDGLAGFGDLRGNEVLARIAAEITSAIARQAMVQVTVGPQDVSVRRTREELAALTRMILAQTEALLSDRREQAAVARGHRDAIAAELSRLHAAQPEWHRLRREVESAQRTFRFYDEKLNEARSIAALQNARMGNVVVVQRPTEHALPKGVSRMTFLTFAVVAGLFLATLYAIVREYFDHRIYAPEQLERALGSRVLAAIPYDGRLAN